MDTPSQPNMLHPGFHGRKGENPFILIVGILGVFFCLTGAALAYGNSFERRVFPGVHIGSYDIGGMDEDSLTKFLSDMHAKLLNHGVEVSYTTESDNGNFVLPLETISSEDVSEFITLDAAFVAQKMVLHHKTGNIFLDSVHALTSLISRPSVSLASDIEYQKEKIFAELDQAMAPHITPQVNADVVVSSISPLKYVITTSSPGVVFQYDDILDQISRFWAALEEPSIHITATKTDPTITETDVESIVTLIPQIFAGGSLNIAYFNSSTKRDYAWKITPTMISRWIHVTRNKDNALEFVLSPSSTLAYLEHTVAPIINVEPQDAKFKVGTDNKVAEFQGSHPGVTVDLDKTYELLAATFAQRFSSPTSSSETITLLTEEVQPKVKTQDVNDLGITEVLGVGTSVFKGSPGNRLKNIKLAAFKKLDGTLVKPGENFSLLNVLKPFTLEAGYLPELVIKGDKEETEIGGGLCQIGTTLFRAAMNSGLEITQRRNHSLMIPYYYDPRNHNPGTDATIYDPGTDFRFLNDTGHYILIMVDMNEKTGDLFFTLWGTSDGRKGYFLPPTVSERYPAGPTKNVETTDLPPGTKKCQPAFPGASASLTYVRELPDGTKKERIFSSYYRPLPETCLVGVEKIDETGVNPDGTPATEVPPASEDSIPLDG